MNKKEVLRIIKAKADKIEYPDLTDKILSKIDFSKPETNEATVSSTSSVEVVLGSPKKKTRKVFIPFMTTLISALLIIVLLFIPHTIKPGPDGPTGKDTLFEVTNLKTMIGYEVYSGASLIDVAKNSAPLNIRGAKRAKPEEENQEEPQDNQTTMSNEEVVKKIHNAVVSSDMLMNKNKFKMKIKKSDKAMYSVLMKCSYEDVDGHRVTYDFYYNETPDHEEDQNFEDIDEVNSTIVGEMTIEGVTYRVVGSKEVEDNESEIELTFYLGDDNLNYFVIKQEMEVNENEYQYRLYKDGELFQQIKHSIENENGVKEASYEVDNYSNNTKDQISLEFDGNNISATLKTNTEEIQVQISITKKGYLYTFGDSTTTTVPKN